MQSDLFSPLARAAGLSVVLFSMGVLPSCSRPVPVIPPEERVSELGGGSCEVSQLIGFHDLESWGAWSAKDPAEIVLRDDLKGAVRIQLTAYTIDDRTPHELNVRLGDITKTITLTPAPKKFDLEYLLSGPAHEIILSGITPRSVPADRRLMGVGLIRVDCAASSGTAR